jgi:hypothetical protein
MKQIPLTRGYVAIVDDDDYERVNRHKWRAQPDKASTRVYAIRTERTGSRKRTISMHRFVLGITDPSIEVDHKNRNGLANWRDNLRVATRSQNAANRKVRSDASSHFKGVTRTFGVNGVSGGRRWKAWISVNGRWHHIGSFHTELAAAAAYNASAYRLFDEFARLNALVNTPSR